MKGPKCLYSSVVERQSCKLKVLGSIPSGGLYFQPGASVDFPRRAKRPFDQAVGCSLRLDPSVVHVHPSCRLQSHPARHCVRVAKEMDSKSIGLCPQGFESPRCRHCHHAGQVLPCTMLASSPHARARQPLGTHVMVAGCQALGDETCSTLFSFWVGHVGRTWAVLRSMVLMGIGIGCDWCLAATGCDWWLVPQCAGSHTRIMTDGCLAGWEERMLAGT